jgi:Ca-activated chloride channel family protein
MDEVGAYLKTRLEQDTLKMIAVRTGGRYFRAGDGQCEEQLVQAILQHARTVEYTRTREPAWFYLSPVFLCIGLVSFGGGVIALRC